MMGPILERKERAGEELLTFKNFLTGRKLGKETLKYFQ